MPKFTVIGDFHYKKRQYSTSVEDMIQIIEDSHKENVDFILHVGDMCVDYEHSPELLTVLLKNKYDIPVYGVMGNHELETNDNPDVVIPYLTNREVTFGEPIYNERQAAHWYTDMGNFRLIGLDTNFVFLPDKKEWQRKMAFWKPEGSILDLSLAPLQLQWFDDVLADAVKQGKKVLIASHAPLIGEPWIFESPDYPLVQEILAKYPKTVLMALNGHIHTDNFEVRNGIAYFDVNTASLGCWFHQKEHHYLPEHTFRFTDYDENGNKLETVDMPYRELTQGLNSWFFKDPLWATVTATEDGHVTVKGRKTEWACGVVPPKENNPGFYARTMPCINDYDAQVW